MTDSRLPTDVFPTAYSMTIKTDLKQRTFSGTSEIALDVKVPVTSVVLHAAAPLVLHSAFLVVVRPTSAAEFREHHYNAKSPHSRPGERASPYFLWQGGSRW